MDKELCQDHIAKLRFLVGALSMLNAAQIDDLNNDDMVQFSAGLIRYTNAMIEDLTGISKN